MMFTLAVAQELLRTAAGRKALGCALGPDTRFEEIGLTSLDLTELLFAIEDHLQDELEIPEGARPETLGELIDLVNRTLAYVPSGGPA
jgi:acyl carrier protein